MIMVLFLRVKTKEYSVDIRRLVWRKCQQKMTYKQISEEVMIPFTAVKGILSRMKKNGGCAQSSSIRYGPANEVVRKTVGSMPNRLALDTAIKARAPAQDTAIKARAPAQSSNTRCWFHPFVLK
ncbi:hypothetical protein PINS_up000472 [Pythium insidiosum]|nr:hypothetical protein PINS_up000472 [Pythium insidiosum]